MEDFHSDLEKMAGRTAQREMRGVCKWFPPCNQHTMLHCWASVEQCILCVKNIQSLTCTHLPRLLTLQCATSSSVNYTSSRTFREILKWHTKLENNQAYSFWKHMCVHVCACVCVCVCARARARVRVYVCIALYFSVFMDFDEKNKMLFNSWWD